MNQNQKNLQKKKQPKKSEEKEKEPDKIIQERETKNYENESLENKIREYEMNLKKK